VTATTERPPAPPAVPRARGRAGQREGGMMGETERWFLLGDRVRSIRADDPLRGLEGIVSDTHPLIVEYAEAGSWVEDPRDVELVRAAQEGEAGDERPGRAVAVYAAMRARTVTLGEVEDALWALAERRDLHDYSDGRDEHICHCMLCQEIMPAILQLGKGSA
jgi:hypothetical protein